MLKPPSAKSLDEYSTVKEVIEFLGGSPWTLQNWDRAGKVQAARHPVNGYRLYRRETLAALHKEIAGQQHFPTHKASR